MDSRRSGFTIMELMLVLVIIVALAAMSYPSIESMYSSVKLEAAGDHIVAQFATARGHAVQEQRVYRFAIEPGTGQYRIAPDEPQFWGGDSGNGPPAEDDGTPPPITVEGTLPGGITFDSLAPGAQIVASTPDPGSWATIVLFLPNGGCSDDTSIRLTPTNGGRPIQITVRGLTGTVNMRPLNPGEN
ncbi:MAG TPA: GspH/FimT family pseudopilin [Gemmataceae bacterium]|jgi:prepilin-type N-terminal cleavage/methylation domain-containing protein|nr:GspH/FimT family pseudopilin [Gemmataceae bacterium]